MPGDQRRPEDMPAHKCGHHGHRNKRGELCGQNVVRGTDHCRHHAGRPLEEHRALGMIRVEASKWRLDAHDGGSIDPRAEILRLISFWKWRSNFYNQLVQDAYEAAERLRQAHAASGILLADPVTTPRLDPQGEYIGEIPEDPALQTARRDLEQVFAHGGVAALVGNKYDVDRDGRIFAVDEGIRALVRLEAEALERLGKACVMAVQAKVAEHRIQMAEQVGVMIQAVILGVLRDLGVSAMDRKVQDLVVMHIDRVSAVPALAA